MEELIEELTKVNPSNLSEEGLKLFNKINEIIDKNKELEEMLKKGIKYTKELEKENKKLKEYIVIAPNLDEMTAIKYMEIQEEGYITGRAEEQQKARKIIHEHYIEKSKIKQIRDKAEVMDYYTLPDVIEDLNKLLEEE